MADAGSGRVVDLGKVVAAPTLVYRGLYRGDTVQRTASCVCGQMAIRCDADPLRVAICHCLSCQRLTGSSFNVAAFFRAQDTETTGPEATYSRYAESGFEVTQHFCPRCGSTVWYQSTRNLDWVAVPVGGFADPTFPPPEAEVFEQHRHAWVVIAK